MNYTDSFSVYIDGVAFTIPPSGFLMDFYGGNQGCSVLISDVSDSYSMYVLGDVFFRNFYVALDYKNN